MAGGGAPRTLNHLSYLALVRLGLLELTRIELIMSVIYLEKRCYHFLEAPGGLQLREGFFVQLLLFIHMQAKSLSF